MNNEIRFKEWNEALIELECAKFVFNNATVSTQIDIAIDLLKNCEDRMEILKKRMNIIGDLNAYNYGHRQPWKANSKDFWTFDLQKENQTILDKVINKLEKMEVANEIIQKVRIWTKKKFN
jgi:hypothetical protein